MESEMSNTLKDAAEFLGFGSMIKQKEDLEKAAKGGKKKAKAKEKPAAPEDINATVTPDVNATKPKESAFGKTKPSTNPNKTFAEYQAEQAADRAAAK